MKKLFLGFALTLIATLSHAQSFSRVIKASSIQYQNGSWVTTQTNYPESMFFIFNGSEVKITNESQSRFVTYGDPTRDYKGSCSSTTWKAYDKDGDRCSFMMFKCDDSRNMLITILYSRLDIGIEYVVEP